MTNKNFAFICRGGKWNLSPAYDLTHCSTGYNGEHATSVNNNGNPTTADLIKVGTDIRIPKSKCETIIVEVKTIVKNELSIKGLKEKRPNVSLNRKI
jgi:serine/threonine-protein kinase HipA